MKVCSVEFESRRVEEKEFEKRKKRQDLGEPYRLFKKLIFYSICSRKPLENVLFLFLINIDLMMELHYSKPIVN